jgi:hypothetical protein
MGHMDSLHANVKSSHKDCTVRRKVILLHSLCTDACKLDVVLKQYLL